MCAFWSIPLIELTLEEQKIFLMIYIEICHCIYLIKKGNSLPERPL